MTSRKRVEIASRHSNRRRSRVPLSRTGQSDRHLRAARNGDGAPRRHRRRRARSIVEADPTIASRLAVTGQVVDIARADRVRRRHQGDPRPTRRDRANSRDEGRTVTRDLLSPKPQGCGSLPRSPILRCRCLNLPPQPASPVSKRLTCEVAQNGAVERHFAALPHLDARRHRRRGAGCLRDGIARPCAPVQTALSGATAGPALSKRNGPEAGAISVIQVV